MSALNEQFLSFLRCPMTKEELALMSADELEAVNKRIEQGECKTQSGELIEAVLVCGLRNASFSRAYRVEDEIPDLLPDNAIILPVAQA